MKFRELLLIMAASIAAGYYLHEPLPDQGYEPSEVATINQLAVTPIYLLQRNANTHKNSYGLTDEPDGEPSNTFGEKMTKENP